MHLDKNMNTEIQNYFKNNNYVIIKDFIKKDLLVVAYEYCKLKAKSIDFKSTYMKQSYDPNWDGKFNDIQSLGNYSCYADIFMETLLNLSTPLMQNFTGKELVPTYSYWRLYEKGSLLERHRDRESCEISTTLCLGFDVSNIDKNVYPDYKWPIYVQSNDNKEIPINLNPGDMLIYKGCELDHWREKFIGINHAQVFLHYNEKNGKFNELYDGRPFLGLPKFIK
jgi:hypothetical protein